MELSTSKKLIIYENQNSNESGFTEYNSGVWFPLPTYQIPECFQSKAVRTKVNTPCLMPNMVVQRDLRTPTVEEEICHYSYQYSARLQNS
jgi:hypothetical protein